MVVIQTVVKVVRVGNQKVVTRIRHRHCVNNDNSLTTLRFVCILDYLLINILCNQLLCKAYIKWSLMLGKGWTTLHFCHLYKKPVTYYH